MCASLKSGRMHPSILLKVKVATKGAVGKTPELRGVKIKEVAAT